MKAITILLMAFCLLIGTSHAQNLSADDIKRFVSIYPQIEALFDDHDEETGVGDLDTFPDYQTIKKAFLETVSKNRNAGKLLKDSGYRSPEHFADQAAHIIQAYVAHQSMEGFAEFEQSLQIMSPQEREFLASQPFYNELENLRIETSKVPQQHLDLVGNYLRLLNEIFAIDDD